MDKHYNRDESNVLDGSNEETEQIISEFHHLQQRGISQKNACNKISEKYGRGYWSILNLIGNGKTKARQTASLFE